MPLSQSESLIVCIQMAFQIWWLFRGAYKVFFKKRRGRRKTILQVCVGWLLPRRLCSALRKQQDIKQNTGTSRESWRYRCKRSRLVNRHFFLQVWKKDGEQWWEPTSLRSVSCNLLTKLGSAFSVSSVQHDEDLGCAARFAIAIKFAFGSTIICDLLFK